MALLGRLPVGPREGIPELLGQGLQPVLWPPVSHWVPAPWVPWSPEVPFGTAPCATQQELAAVGAASQAWHLQEKHLLFLVCDSSFPAVWRTEAVLLVEAAEGAVPTLYHLCWSVPSLSSSSSSGQECPWELWGHLLPEDRQSPQPGGRGPQGGS